MKEERLNDNSRGTTRYPARLRKNRKAALERRNRNNSTASPRPDDRGPAPSDTGNVPGPFGRG